MHGCLATSSPRLILQTMCFCCAARPATGTDMESVLRGSFLSSFPWGCRVCDRKFKIRPYLVDHSRNSHLHHTKLLQALKSSVSAEVCFHQAPSLDHSILIGAWQHAHCQHARHPLHNGIGECLCR